MQDPAKRLWPESSEYLCWHCCHSFDTVPVFLPIPNPTDPIGYRLSGNFCSWNCVKAYYYTKAQSRNKACSVQDIALMAFLTCHRPRYCPTPTKRHTSSCPCLDYYKGLKMAAPKEVLHKFGGSTSIVDYRNGFMTVDNVKWIERCFIKNNDLDLITSPRLRSFTYSFEQPSNGMTKAKEEEQPDSSKPVVHKKRIILKPFFG